MSNGKLFTTGRIGPITLRNRSIRSAAFEGMCPGGIPSESLINYHRSLAAGGIGMTTVAYVSVTNGGRTFSHQSWMNRDIVSQLKILTDAVHKEGALASIQLGHAGNMSDKKVSGERVIAPSGLLNLFGLIIPKKMTEDDINGMIKSYGNAVMLAREAGFDAVEVHAGHGYLISQFLSPHTNRRSDKWGGSFENRARFLKAVMAEVKKTARNDIAVIVKTNLEDGFKGGVDKDESIEVAKILESEGADALILSGGFVSKTPFYMMRGKNPHKELIKNQKDLLIKMGMVLFSRIVLKEYLYEEAFFLEDALRVRDAVKLPLIYVGGLLSSEKIEEVLHKGFDFVALARALVVEPDFINIIHEDRNHISKCRECGPCNSCVATMYDGEMRCTFIE
ncbi:NADH:flavin oxidoreductase [Spirochaetota bacterium]